MRFALALALLLGAAPALAHSWYPSECCGGQDCHEIEATDLLAQPGGWLIKATGEIWPYSKTRAPPDGRFHRCWHPSDGTTICLWVPPPGA